MKRMVCYPTQRIRRLSPSSSSRSSTSKYFLLVSFCPLELSWVAFELYHRYSAFARTEPECRTIVFTYIVPVPDSIVEAQKAHVCSFIVNLLRLSSSSHSASFTFSFAKDQNITNSYWTFNVTCHNSHSIWSF